MSKKEFENSKVPGSHKAGMLLCRSVVVVLMSTGMMACAAVESQPVQAIVVEKVVIDDGLSNASLVYNSRDYEAALAEFKVIAINGEHSASSRRMAYLGEALIYLSSDKKWHSLENAKMALGSAGQVVPAKNDEFSLAVDMLMDAITITIGTESRYTQLHSKSGNFSSEVVRLKSERDSLMADNEKLRKEQLALNEVLERLKNLTLGN